MRIRYSWEVPVLGSAGGPKRAIPLLATNPESRPNPEIAGPDPDFLILNGDTLTDVEPSGRCLDDHRRSGALVTMAVVPNTEPEKYSGVGVGPTGRSPAWVATRIDVSPRTISSASRWPNRRRSPRCPRTRPLRSARCIPRWSRRARVRCARFGRRRVHGHRHAVRLSRDVAACWQSAKGSTRPQGPRSVPTARIERSILWDDVIVEDGAMLRGVRGD